MSDLVKVNVRKTQCKGDIALQSSTKEELIERVTQLEAHVVQLRNLLKSRADDQHATQKNQRPFDYKKFAKRHVLLHVAYTGWDFNGFVVQEQTEKTVEAELFKAFEKTCLLQNRETSNYHRCGRTDKGVSSFGQVISIDLRSNLTSGTGVFIPEDHYLSEKVGKNKEEIPYAFLLNKVLPKDIRVIGWAPVAEGFSARFDCLQRTYRYYFPKGNLDIDRMCSSFEFMVGEHDFRNLCKMDVGNGVVNFKRRLISLNVEPVAGIQDGETDGYTVYRLTVVGQAFLWHQIRCIVALLFLIGRGHEEPTVIKDLLDVDKNPRKPQYSMASELPLNLFHCSYPDSIKWIYHEEALLHVINDYQTMWTQHTIKASMLKEMLSEVEKLTKNKVSNQSKDLIQGVMPKNYIPLLKRQQCDSLEQRIEHYAKRKRIEIVDEATAEKR